jgi:hypothetical protein
MNDETWLRNALRAAASPPPAPDRAGGALALAARRRRERTVALSCVAVVSVMIASLAFGNGSGPAGLRPLPPAVSPTWTGDAMSPSASASPEGPATSEPGLEVPGQGQPKPTPGGSVEPTGRSMVPIDEVVHPPVPTPLDVYVLLDTTFSVSRGLGDLDAAIRRIDDGLRARNVAAQWGLGVFTDTDFTPTGDPPPVYHRVRAIGSGVVTTDGVRTNGGGGPEEEADTLALEGAVGVAHVPWTRDSDAAGFRPGVRSVILLVTDAGMDENAPNPSIDDAIATMNTHDVTVVGLQVLTQIDPAGASENLGRVAGATGGVAANDVDVDGDGIVDLRAGRPLVWEWADDGDTFGFGAALAALAR